MHEWMSIGTGLILILMTVAIKGIRWVERNAIKRVLRGLHYQVVQEKNNDRRDCLIISCVVLLLSIMVTPVSSLTLAISSIVNGGLICIVIGYWLFQPNMVNVPKLDSFDDE